jgi:tRNA dimethylallyltransferase
MNKAYDMLVVTGPTASGKTSLAAQIACILGGEIISADSRQVYRNMNLGTGKDYADYIVEGKEIPYHLIDIAEPGYKYNIFEYQKDFLDVYRDLKNRKVFPVVCGGSGMYIDSIIRGYRLIQVPENKELRKELEAKTMEDLATILSTFKELHNTSDIDSKKRAIRAIEIEKYYMVQRPEQNDFPHIRSLITGIKYDREYRRKRISARLKQRIDEGMIDEVKQLIDNGVDSETLIYYGLEYKYITMFLKGSLSYGDMFSGLEIAIHQFAKRQMTWFRGMERRGIEIRWLDGFMPLEEKIAKVLGWLGEESIL